MSTTRHPTSEVPLALEDSGLRRCMAGRTPAVFTDYDGTLTPIVARPELARIDAAMAGALGRLASICVVGIISGRDLEDVRSIAHAEHVWYAGSHGMDLLGPDGTRHQHPGSVELAPDLAAAADELEDRLASIPHAWVERKRFATAAHYRQVDATLWPAVAEAVDATLAGHPRLRRTGGKCIYELRPDVDWDKGRALWWLFDRAGLDRSGTVALYLGDDLTDEDAFAALGDDGVGIVVVDYDRPTYADVRVRDVAEVLLLLEDLVDYLEDAKA
ncbi:MAG: trehalose-phosphatase [Acidimicrobiia bacterium]